MHLDPRSSNLFRHVATAPPGPTRDVMGATIEIISTSTEFWVLRGVVPPGSVVPLHRHADTEDFLILSGSQQVLITDGTGLAWRDACAGDYIHVPANVVHAHRNVSTEPAIDLIVTTARLGQFFLDVGRPITDAPAIPTEAELAHFLAKSAEYGYVLGTPEENAAYGIEVPSFAGG